MFHSYGNEPLPVHTAVSLVSKSSICKVFKARMQMSVIIHSYVYIHMYNRRQSKDIHPKQSKNYCPSWDTHSRQVLAAQLAESRCTKLTGGPKANDVRIIHPHIHIHE